MFYNTTANGHIVDSADPARLAVTSVFKNGSFPMNQSANYNVLDTDYQTYSLVYQCAVSKDCFQNFKLFHRL